MSSLVNAKERSPSESRASRDRAELNRLRVEAATMKTEHEAKLAECEGACAQNEAELKRVAKKHETDLKQLTIKAAESAAKAKRVERKLKANLDFLRLHANEAFEGEDVRIKLKYPDGGKLQHARRFVLASKSPVFKRMFGNGTSRRNDRFYTINHCSAPVMRAVLKFCHDAEIEFTKEVTAEDVLTVARDYGIGHLQTVCMDEILENWENLDSAQDTNSEAVDFAVFEYVCSGVIAFTEGITALEVMKVACHRRLPKLEKECTKEVLTTLNNDNLSHILSLSKKWSATRLQEEATKYLKENFDTAFPEVMAAL